MSTVTDPATPKGALHHYLRSTRAALLCKIDGLPERELRLPRTPTGTNLLGLIKHCANLEADYFGPVFGRAFPHPGEIVSEADPTAERQQSWFATAAESADQIVDRYQRVCTFADETITELSLDAVGHVSWWPAGHGEVTLHRVLVHVITDVSRHAGHADILREGIDGATGTHGDGSNMPALDWPAYVERLTVLAGPECGGDQGQLSRGGGASAAG